MNRFLGFRLAAAALVCGSLASCNHGIKEMPTWLTSTDQTVTLAEMHHVLVYGDFGDRAQPFQQAFVTTMRNKAAACGIAIDFELVEHATTLTLDPPKVLSVPELDKRMAAVGAYGLVRVAVTGWSSQGGAMPARLDQPLTHGRLNLTVTLGRKASVKAAWTGTYQQKIDGLTGGDQLADDMMQHFAEQGAFPKCSFLRKAS